MEKEYIEVKDISLASTIRNELKRLGISPKYTGVLDFQKFTKEELGSLKRLRLENNTYTDISVLEYCTNLKDLSIISLNSKGVKTNFTSEAYYSYKSKRANIKDFSVISKLKSLEFLTIQDDDNLSSLDLTDLTELTSLTLTGNHKLTTVTGLETLTSLSYLSMVNNAVQNKFNLKTMIDNGLSEVDLDFDLYPIVKKEFPDIAEKMCDLTKTGITCKWSENLSDIRFNVISTLRMEKMDLQAEKILDSIIGPNYTDIEKICAIYAYIIQNVEYDYDSLNAAKYGEENQALKKARENLSELNSTILDRRQSSYNAILEKKSVCEGYTNMMHYLLKCVGINSMTVHCSADLDTSVVGSNSNHSVIRVEIDGESYYFDPTWDAKKKHIVNFFKTKEEFSINHVLSMTEEEITSNRNKKYTNEQLSKIFTKVINDRKLGKNRRDNILKNNEQKVNKPTAGKFSNDEEKLDYIRMQYQVICEKIERLMNNNNLNPINRYQDKLNILMRERDKLNEEIDPVIKKQKTSKLQKEKEHELLVSKIERLLGIHITPVAKFVYASEFKVPRIILKDRDTLIREKENIDRKLRKLYFYEKIDFETYDSMRKAIVKELVSESEAITNENKYIEDVKAKQ